MSMEQNQSLDTETQEVIEAQIIEIPQVNISEKGTVVASSLDISKFFDKRHDNVLQGIENLKKDLPEDFYLLNFQDTHRATDCGQNVRKDPMYNLTRDGFALLAMGFTGDKALQFKVRYIQAFNAMEQTLSTKHEKIENHVETERVITPTKIPTRDIFAPFRPRKTISKLEMAGIQGLMHFVAYVEKIPYATVEKYFLERNFINSLENLNKEKGDAACGMLWSLIRIANQSVFTPHHETLDEMELTKNALYGLMDFWEYGHGELTKKEIKNYVFNICCVGDLEEIQTLIDLRKALFVVYRGIFLYLSYNEGSESK